MKYLKTWRGYNPQTEKNVTRMRIIDGAKRLSHEIGTQKDEVFYRLTEESEESLKLEVMNELRKQKQIEKQREIDKVSRNIESLIEYREHLRNQQ